MHLIFQSVSSLANLLARLLRGCLPLAARGFRLLLDLVGYLAGLLAKLPVRITGLLFILLDGFAGLLTPPAGSRGRLLRHSSRLLKALFGLLLSAVHCGL